MARNDPLMNAEPLIRRVYSYVAYRLGDTSEAEDVTGDVFERALRYRSSYDPSRGDPTAWLLGIARRCVDDAMARRPALAMADDAAGSSSEDVEAEALERLTLQAALSGLDDRSRELIALRYGADLTARQIGRLLGMKTNAVEVALHRSLARLRTDLAAAVVTTRPAPDAAAEPL